MPRTTLALVTALTCPCVAFAQGDAPKSMPATPLMTPALSQQRAQKDAEKERETPLYDENADAKQQIDDALARAKRENTRVLIQWGGNWCVWCIRLDRLYRTDKDIRRELQYEYETVFVDAGRPDAKNVDLAMGYGADLKKHGVPFLTILNADGAPITNQETGSLEVTNEKGESAGVAAGHDPKAVLAFLKAHEATPLVATDVLAGARETARSEHKAVFLHFGAPWCGWCHRLEGWMRRPETAAVLAKYFVDCKIDVDRMTGGKDMQKQFMGDAKTGIPLFFFVDPEGKTIASSIGTGGNIGYPGGDEEAPHFRTMLQAAMVGENDIATLTKTVRLDTK